MRAVLYAKTASPQDSAQHPDQRPKPEINPRQGACGRRQDDIWPPVWIFFRDRRTTRPAVLSSHIQQVRHRRQPFLFETACSLGGVESAKLTIVNKSNERPRPAARQDNRIPAKRGGHVTCCLEPCYTIFKLPMPGAGLPGYRECPGSFREQLYSFFSRTAAHSICASTTIANTWYSHPGAPCAMAATSPGSICKTSSRRCLPKPDERKRLPADRRLRIRRRDQGAGRRN